MSKEQRYDSDTKKKKKSSQEKKFEKDIQTVFHIERTPIKYGLLLHNIAVM